MKEILLIIFTLISLIKLLQSQKQGQLNNNFKGQFETYLIKIYLYDNFTNTSDDQNFYYFSYIKNTSKFLYYVINKRSKEIEFIGDELTVPSIFKESKFITVSFYDNSSYIYYLIEKNNDKYIGVYSILSHMLIYNRKVDKNTTFVYNKPKGKDLHLLEFFIGNENTTTTECPFKNDEDPCTIPNNLNIDLENNSTKLIKCDNKKVIYEVSNLTYCINECPNKYIVKDNKCSFECGNGKYHLNLEKCVSRCDESEIKINKNYCLSCELSKKIKGINNEICVDNCTDLYNVSYIENNQCIKKCKIGSLFNSTHCVHCKDNGLFLNESIMKCVDKCENDIYDEYNICFNCRDRGLIYYEKTINNKTEKGCIKDCSDLNLEFDKKNKICKQCQENYIFHKEIKECISKNNCKKNINKEVCENCLDYINNDNKCINYENDITYCNIGSSIEFDKKKCRNCSDDFFLYLNNSCVQNCDLYNVKDKYTCLDCINEDKNKFYENFNCVEKCSAQKQIVNNICLNCKDAGKKYYDKEGCIYNCPNYTMDEETYCTTCLQMNPLKPYYNIKNNTCTKECDENQVKAKKNNIDVCETCKLIFNESCYKGEKCPDHTFQNGIRCGICNNSQIYFNKGCIDKCIEGYINKTDHNNIKFCKNCIFFLENECINDSCENHNSFPYNKIISDYNTTICQKCVCNEKGGICQKKLNYDKSDYFCNCSNNYYGDFCHIFHMNKTKDFYIYLYTKFPPTYKNRVGFKYKYNGKEKIKQITWGIEKNCFSKHSMDEKEYINGINEDIFILNGNILYSPSCNNTISANLTLNNGNSLKDELVINNIIIDIDKYVIFNYKVNDSNNYCPLKNNISFNINLTYWNSSYNFSYQLLYDRNERFDQNIYFEFTKEFYHNQFINNFISPGKNFALKIKSRNGEYMIKKNYQIVKYKENCYNINEVFKKNDNSFVIFSKLLYLFDYYNNNKSFTLNLTINHLNDIQDFLIKEFNEKLKEEEIENINSEKYNENYYKEKYFYKSRGDNLYNLKSNSFELLIRLMLTYLYDNEPNNFEKGVEILSNTTKILFNYKLDFLNNFNISYLSDTYNIFINKIINENKINNRNKIFNILFLDIQKLTSIISHSIIVGEMFELSKENINFQIEKLGKNQNIMAINNYTPKRKIIDKLEEFNKNIELYIENKELNNIINEINQFEKVNKTNISVSIVSFNNINYLKNFVNSTQIELKNVISKNFKIINLLSDNLYNPYIQKKHYFYQIQFRVEKPYKKNNTFCAPINYIDKNDTENYCKTYFKQIQENKKKEEIIICECNKFTQIGVFENEYLANFYKNIQFDVKKYNNLLSNIILITSFGILSFFSIILLCFDLNEEKKMEKLKKMEEIEKVKYYYDKVSYLDNINVISFSWNLFYFYSPFCQIFNIHSFKFPRHTRFMIELIKILLTLIITILNYRKGDISKLNNFINQRNYDKKNESIHFLLFKLQSKTMNFLFILCVYFIINIIFDYIYKILGNESIYKEKWKQMKTLITDFTYNEVKFESLFDEKWKKIRIKIFALSKICGESILKGLKRKDKFSKYLNQSKNIGSINDSSSVNDSNLKEPLIGKSENFLDNSSQANIFVKKDKKLSKYEKIKNIFQKYNTIQKNKREGNESNNDTFTVSKVENDFNELNPNSGNLFWNIFSNIILIFFIFLFERILKYFVDEVSEIYGFSLVFIWYIPTIIIIIFYNFVINYLVCVLISFIFYKSYYRTPSKIKKWFINKLIRNYKYYFKIKILISKNKSDIDDTIKNIIKKDNYLN